MRGSAPSDCYDCVWGQDVGVRWRFWYNATDYTLGNPANVSHYDNHDDLWWALEGRTSLTGNINLAAPAQVFEYQLYGTNGFPLSSPETREITDMMVEIMKLGKPD